MAVITCSALIAAFAFAGFIIGRLTARRPDVPKRGAAFLCEECSEYNTVGAPLLRCRSCGHEAPLL